MNDGPSFKDDTTDENSKELELIVDKFRPLCINHNIYCIIVGRKLSREIRNFIFKDSKIEYGNPNIDLPPKFFSDAGIEIVANWLEKRGVTLNSKGTMTITLSEFLVAETRPQAEKIVEEAIAAIEKQKAG